MIANPFNEMIKVATDIWAIVGCEESQAITIELRKLGVNAFSCDLKPCSGGHPEWHLQMDVFEAIDSRKWDMAIFHPECTYLTVTANKWLKDQPERKSGALVGQARRAARKGAIDFFMRLTECSIDRWVIENPVGCMSTAWRKADQIIQPFMFGFPETKKTCLWVKNMPLLKPTNIVEPKFIIYGGKRYSPTHAHNGGNSEVRSKTTTQVAEAMAKQYVNHILNYRELTLF